MFSLKNKITLVTGAGSGIGAAIAETFAQAGATVFATDRDEKGGAATTARINAAGGKARFLKLDITNEADIAAAVAAVGGPARRARRP